VVEEVDFEIGHFCTFQTSVTLTLDRVIRNTVLSSITHQPLHAYQISFKSENVLWTDKRTSRPALPSRPNLEEASD